jgi:uncharacterized delta-60 repeat protein
MRSAWQSKSSRKLTPISPVSASILLLAVFLLLSSAIPAGAVTKKWTDTYNQPVANASDTGSDVAVAPGGAVYVVGTYTHPTQEQNIWLRKYSSGGIVQWTEVYDNSIPGGGMDFGRDVAVAPDGTVYIVGYVESASDGMNIWIRQYAPDGTPGWTDTVDGADHDHDRAYGIAVGPNGRLYVIGSTIVSGENTNIWLRKYTPAGSVKWTKIKNGPVNGADTGWAVAVSPNGRSVYAAGSIDVGMPGSNNIWIRKYSKKGKKKWTRTHDGPDSESDIPWSIAVAPDGMVYVAGHEDAPDEGGHIWVRKYTPGGTVVWTRTHSGDSAEDRAHGVAVGSGGGVYVTGFKTIGGDSRIWLRKYTSGGGVAWTKKYNQEAFYDNGQGVAVSPNGAIYVAGSVYVTGEGQNIWIRKYK